MAGPYLLVIDQGTTSTRAAVFDRSGACRGQAGLELAQHYPQPGWVEHDADEIWTAVAAVVPAALAEARATPAEVAALGLTNQRETVVVWERATGTVRGRAIVWQDRRTAAFCRDHAADADWLQDQTGLVLDPYFSATKLRWMLDQDAALRAAAERGEWAAGTIDSFLIWRLTGGRAHVTDVTNASRTLLLGLRTLAWDDELCLYFGVPTALLPEVRPSVADFGSTHGLGFLPDGLPIRGVAGDQQAALFGQGGFAAGSAKCTYGTGAFFLQHVGPTPVRSRHRLLASPAATAGEPGYVLEGSIFVAGAAVQWLRDGLKLFAKAADVERLAAQSGPAEPVLFVPGLVGLGAPHWVPEACGVLFGLTRATNAADLARAALEGVAYQVADLIDAVAQDTGTPPVELRVDGGMAQNEWFVQCQADVLGLPVLRAPDHEATARGAAFLAGLGAGLWPNTAHLSGLLAGARRFEPRLDAAERERRLRRWRRAVRAVVDFYRAG